jgi:hypothetical protein
MRGKYSESLLDRMFCAFYNWNHIKPAVIELGNMITGDYPADAVGIVGLLGGFCKTG